LNENNQIKIPLQQKIILVVFGLFLTLIILEISLRLGGFIILSLQEYRNLLSLRQKGEYRILCLGESTTQGEWPPYLDEILNQSNLGIKFSVIDKGVVGTNTSVILSKLESYLDTYHPDMVITMTGINDWGTHVPYGPVSDSKAINFLKSFRIYKLARLLWLYIVTRFNEFKYHDAPKPKLLAQRNTLQQAYVEHKKEFFPRDDKAYLELGMSYLEQARFPEAEEAFKKAMELNPRNDKPYLELGKSYQAQKKYLEAEEFFNKAIEFNPKNYEAYFGLGWLYQDLGRYFESEASLKKALEINPGVEIYGGLANFYRDHNRFSEAEGFFKKAIEFDPQNDITYLDLGYFYRDRGRLPEAEEALKKAVELNPRNGPVYAMLEVLYLDMGKKGLARKYGKEARNLRSHSYRPITAANYKKLKAILDKRGIAYVCVQYPMRNIELLKKLFQGNDKDIIFVDNEKVFKNEVAKYGHQDYFVDLFGGEFGHCTEKGNRLLAKNIARVILKEVFGK